MGETTPVHVRGIPDAVAFRVDGAPATGRIVLLEFGAARPDLAHFGTCERAWRFGETRIRCLVPDASGTGPGQRPEAAPEHPFDSAAARVPWVRWRSRPTTRS